MGLVSPGWVCGLGWGRVSPQGAQQPACQLSHHGGEKPPHSPETGRYRRSESGWQGMGGGRGGRGVEMLVAFINEGFPAPRKKRGEDTLEGAGPWEPADLGSGPNDSFPSSGLQRPHL